MHVVTPKEMVRIEKLAYGEGAQEELFMDRAGAGVALVIEHLLGAPGKPVFLLCGKGNNGGDAYVAGCLLLKKGFPVVAWQVGDIATASPLCQKHYHQFEKFGGRFAETLEGDYALIIDALFGTGFHGIARDPYASAIAQANTHGAPILSVDIPSGLDGTDGVVEGEAVRAAYTAFLGLPKRGFFLGKGWKHVGQLVHVDFGLEPRYIDQAAYSMKMVTEEQIVLPSIVNDRHKYQTGMVVGWGGSPGMPGAALLAGYAALRSGAGMMKLLHAPGMEAELAAAPYELIRVPFDDEQEALALLNKASACFVGPGIGRDTETGEKLRRVLPRIATPCVIDADALSLLAEEMCPLPERTILTPHRGEMARLLGIPTPEAVDTSFLEHVQNFAEEHQCRIILKGGPSFLFSPGAETSVSPVGDPGMATAGSGDVLTGIVAAMAAQHLPLDEAARSALLLHGLAGEIAASRNTSYAMIAGDIIEALPDAFREG